MTEVTDEIINLKAQRTRLKSKLTSLKRQLSTASINDIGHIKELYDQLKKNYSEVNDVHYEYSDLVSDEKYSEHRVVASLDLDSYIAAIQDTYKEACAMYDQFMMKLLEYDISLAIRTANSMGACNQSVISKHVDYCKELCSQHFVFTNRAHEELEKVIIALQTSPVAQSPNSSPPVGDNSAALSAMPGARGAHGVDDSTGPGGASVSSVNVISSGEPGNSTPIIQHDRSQPLVVSSANIISQASVALSGRLDHSIVSAYEGYQLAGPRLTGSMQPSAESSNYSKYKKRPPPTFDGTRRDWPEFRSVWRRYAYSEFCTDEQQSRA